MASHIGSILVLAVAGFVSGKPTQSPTQDLSILMPGVQPQIADTYLCFPMKLEDDSVYLTGFKPMANSSTAHHMLLYGCEEPGENAAVWNCGEMAAENPQYAVGPVCKEGAKIVYAWAMDAPKLTLPKDVAFKVGSKTSIKWLVLQVHYKDVTNFLPPENVKDHSGIVLDVTKTPQPKRAGVYLLGTGGEIPGHSTVYMETACSLESPITIHPFAFRSHAHSHGEVVSGYRVRNGHWDEIGRISPKKPQMFYNISHPGMTIQPGDSVAARCTMVNNEDKTIAIGSTQKDEMCNFYIMYWVDGDEILPDEYCFSDGPPNWYWSDMQQLNSENAPRNASLVPGAEKVLEATSAGGDVDESQQELTEQDILKYLAMYDEAAFENYVYNLLMQENNEYDNGGVYPGQETYEGEGYPEGYFYNAPSANEGYYPEDNEVEGEEEGIEEQEIQALLSQFTPEQLQRYYKQLDQEPM